MTKVENSNVNNTSEQQKKIKILEKIREEASFRPLVPFLGAGISVSAGFPTIKFVIQYLAKVDFAIHFGVFEDRFPVIREDQQSAMHTYQRHPSKYLEDFGWPNYGQLNADIWDWLAKDGRKNVVKYCKNNLETYENEYKEAQNSRKSGSKYKNLPVLPDLLANDITENYQCATPYMSESTDKKKLELRDHQQAIVQWTLRKELAERENGTTKPLLYRWLLWKRCYFDGNQDRDEPELLYGDWEVLLDRLCEGNFNLVDTLFASFERGLNPTPSHRFLAFLKPKLGMPIILTTNFDSLLERAFQDEGVLPKVFDVHRDAELPSTSLVRQQFSLIKLHGSAYGLRLGERLKYQLETDARNNTLGYIPQDAIVLVMGFNGSERRIMQMLQAIVGEGRFDEENPRLIWVQGPSEPGPLFHELIKASNGAVLECKVGHADTFLEELYFLMTRSSYQSSAKSYSTVPNRPLMIRLKEFTSVNKKEKADKRRPVQLCVGQIQEAEDAPSSNWSSLAGMALANSFGLGYTIIWINLESHHTVEGIIAEFFHRVRVLDPQAPSCVITNMDKDPEAAIKKTLDRISDVFKRGRYILVLDAVESFGRPQMVHHGMTSAENEQKGEFKGQAYNLTKFIKALLRIEKEQDIDDFYWDSYVIVTADKPRLRHRSSNDEVKPDAYLIIEDLVRLLGDIDITKHTHITVRLQPDIGYKDLITDIDIQPEPNPAEKLSICWKFDKKTDSNNAKSKTDSTLKRAEAVLSLLTALRDSPDKGINRDAIEAFICLLSVFRRPRSLPLIHSIIDRWVLRKIRRIRLDDETCEKAHKAITGLLQTISTLPESTNKKDDIGIVTQNHEGGTVWLYREVYETTYDALTEHLRVRDWKNAWVAEQDCPKESNFEQAIIDGILNITWHMYAARSYYVDIFLPSHDIRAFYEYLYHRVSATKIITLLITIIERNDNAPHIIDNLNVYCEILFEGYKLNIKKDIEKETDQLETFAWYASVIGVFDPCGSERREIDLLEKSYDQLNPPANFKTLNLMHNLKVLRRQAVETLLTALNKNKLLFRAVATPDTIIAWSDQFLNLELDCMREIEINGITYGQPDDIKITMDALESQFKKLRFQAWLSKMDYESILKDCLYGDNSNEKVFNKNSLLEECIALKNQKTEKYEFSKIEIETLNKYDGFDDKYKIREIKIEFNKAVDKFKLIPDDLDLFKSVEIKLEKIFLISRCLVERCDQLPIISTHKIEKKLLEIKSQNPDILRRIKKHRRYALELKCRSKFINWFYWEPLLNRENSSDRTKSLNTRGDKKNRLLKNLQDAENDSIQYEDLLRATTETNDDDAKCRSTALTIRARALYLRGHFQQAHHFLDLATTGFLPDRLDHKIYISIVHIVRAELLAISAHEHYYSLSKFDQVRKKLKENYIPFHEIEPEEVKIRKIFDKFKVLPGSHFKEFPKRISDFAKLLLPIANSSLKKIERAEQELRQTETLLRDLSHHNIWLIYLEFGCAQIQIERMLYEIEILFLSWQQLSVTEYLQKSGHLEQKILNVLRRIRNVMDAIPYRSDKWNDMEKERRVRGLLLKGRLLFRIEYGAYMLWRQLFVVGAYYSSLLNCLYRNKGSIHLNEDTTIFDIAEQFIPCLTGLALTGKNAGKYHEQWILWCKAMRFENFSGEENMRTFDLAHSQIEEGKVDESLKSLSLRATIIKSMIAESDDKKIEKMWGIRRDQNKEKM